MSPYETVTIPYSIYSSGRSKEFVQENKLTKIKIPYGVTSIGGEAFRRCDSLTSVTIPNSVTSIGYWAFDGCESLHVEIASHPDGNLRVLENAFESGAKVSFRGTTGTWEEIRAKYFGTRS